MTVKRKGRGAEARDQGRKRVPLAGQSGRLHAVTGAALPTRRPSTALATPAAGGRAPPEPPGGGGRTRKAVQWRVTGELYAPASVIEVQAPDPVERRRNLSSTRCTGSSQKPPG